MAHPEEQAPSDPLIGRVIDGRFTLLSVLGRGGMGIVYRAHQASLERSVALKLMRGLDPEREAEFQRRFFLEAATAARLKHQNTITVFDYGSTVIDEDRAFFITMELVDGVTLSRLLRSGRALPPLRAVHLAMQMARGLREAHRHGVVHRDFKPGNVMVLRPADEGAPPADDDVDVDFVKVLDFGLAKTRGEGPLSASEGLTKAGTFMGSPRYVAPEQIEGRAIDARADVYSFGCVLYRMLSGRVPFDGKAAAEVMMRHMNEAPEPLDAVIAARGNPFGPLPRGLVQLTMECLAKDAKDRPQTMDDVLQRLKVARGELGGLVSGVVAVPDELSLRNAAARPLPVTDPGIAAAPGQEPPKQTPANGRGLLIAERSDAAARVPPGAPRIATPRALPAAPSQTGGLDDAPGIGPDWSLGGRVNIDDSTRPTRVLGQLTRAPARRYAPVAIALGVVVGLLVGSVAVLWKTGLLDKIQLRRRAPVVQPASDPVPAVVPAGPLAEHAKLRLRTTPPGADVLEVENGLPRLLGVTPLTIDWNVADKPRVRLLTLRKDGYIPAKASVAPPAKGQSEPVWLDVDATLKLAAPPIE